MVTPRVWLVRPSAGRFCVFWGLFQVEEVDGDRIGHDEIVSVFFDGVDGGGFDGFDGVEEAIESHEAVEVVDSDAAESGFEA